jgi:glucan phosphoethanolaminetransferase (alkaline phosphatase superfamily)
LQLPLLLLLLVFRRHPERSEEPLYWSLLLLLLLRLLLLLLLRLLLRLRLRLRLLLLLLLLLRLLLLLLLLLRLPLLLLFWLSFRAKRGTCFSREARPFYRISRGLQAPELKPPKSGL